MYRPAVEDYTDVDLLSAMSYKWLFKLHIENIFIALATKEGQGILYSTNDKI